MMFEANDVPAYLWMKYLFSLPQPFFFLHLAYLTATCVLVQEQMLWGHFGLTSVQINPVLLPQPVWSLHDPNPLWHQNAKLCVWLLLTCSSLAWPRPLPSVFKPPGERLTAGAGARASVQIPWICHRLYRCSVSLQSIYARFSEQWYMTGNK